jgi:N-acylneuraminate cytidylyltransferase
MHRRLSVLALIPARGGSKGVPRKNIRPLAGLPLIAHTIRAAARCPSIDRIIVSTDDVEIARVARRFGADVPFLRPRALAQDQTTDAPVVKHCLDFLRKSERYQPDIIVFLRPTGPFRTTRQIESAIALLAAHRRADSVRSVNMPRKTPYKMWVPGRPFMKPLLRLPGVREPFNAPRQSLPVVWESNPAINVMWSRTVSMEMLSLSAISL